MKRWNRLWKSNPSNFRLRMGDGPMGNVIEVKDSETFHALSKAHLPVVVDFWVPWCGACRSMKPVFTRLAERYSAKAQFACVNVEDVPQLSRSIEYLPTFAVYRNGHLVCRIVGVTSFEEFQRVLEPLVLVGETGDPETLHQSTLTPRRRNQ
jgi:thioredoxin 1